MTREIVVFWNVDNNRSAAAYEAGIKRLTRKRGIRRRRPAILGLCETTNADLPALKNYRRIRDRKPDGRGNLTMYVRRNLPVTDIEWVDLDFTWPNTQRPGTHWPRSILAVTIGSLRTAIWHAPPNNAKNAPAGQREGIRELRRLRPHLVLGDWNRRKGDSHGPSTLAQRLPNGRVRGHRIDAAVIAFNTGGCNVKYPKMSGDHGHAFEMTFRAPARLWKKPSKK